MDETDYDDAFIMKFIKSSSDTGSEEKCKEYYTASG